MISKNLDRQSVLSEINKKFMTFRKKNKGGRLWYPEVLKALAVAALDMGVPIFSVVEASGVSDFSIYKWRQSQVKPQRSVRELLVVEKRGRELEDKTQSMQNPLACIRLRSGVCIEVPVTSLGADLIQALQGGV